MWPFDRKRRLKEEGAAREQRMRLLAEFSELRWRANALCRRCDQPGPFWFGREEAEQAILLQGAPEDYWSTIRFTKNRTMPAITYFHLTCRHCGNLELVDARVLIDWAGDRWPRKTEVGWVWRRSGSP